MKQKNKYLKIKCLWAYRMEIEDNWSISKKYFDSTQGAIKFLKTNKIESLMSMISPFSFIKHFFYKYILKRNVIFILKDFNMKKKKKYNNNFSLEKKYSFIEMIKIFKSGFKICLNQIS